jgi:hypothetical protein
MAIGHTVKVANGKAPAASQALSSVMSKPSEGDGEDAERAVRDRTGGDGVEQMLPAARDAAAIAILDMARERGRLDAVEQRVPTQQAWTTRGSGGSSIPFAPAIRSGRAKRPRNVRVTSARPGSDTCASPLSSSVLGVSAPQSPSAFGG